VITGRGLSDFWATMYSDDITVKKHAFCLSWVCKADVLDSVFRSMSPIYYQDRIDYASRLTGHLVCFSCLQA